MINIRIKKIEFIPIRKGSKTIKNKNIKKIAWIPLISMWIKKLSNLKIYKNIIAYEIIKLNLPKNKKLELFKRSKNLALFYWM